MRRAPGWAGGGWEQTARKGACHGSRELAGRTGAPEGGAEETGEGAAEAGLGEAERTAVSLGPSGLTGTQAQVTAERRGEGLGARGRAEGSPDRVCGEGGRWDSPLPASV